MGRKNYVWWCRLAYSPSATTKYPVHLTVGYFHPPSREFIFADHIDAEFVSDWMAQASLTLMVDQSFKRDGRTIRSEELVPMAVMDAGLDRLFLTHAGARCVNACDPRGDR